MFYSPALNVAPHQLSHHINCHITSNVTTHHMSHNIKCHIYGGPEGSDITHKGIECKLKKIHANLKKRMQIKKGKSK